MTERGGPGQFVSPEPWSHNLHYHRVIFDAAAVVGTRLHHAARSWKRRAAVGWLGVTGRPTAAYQPPVIWPPPLTYRDMRRLATGVLAAARYRRHLCWRHSLVWTKPP